MSPTARAVAPTFPTLSLLLWLASLPPVAQAQPAQPLSTGALSGEVEVRLVDLEVIVADADGEPVPGLTRDDFTLLQDGVELPISHFAAWAPEPSPGLPAEASLAPHPRREDGEAEERLNLVIYVDPTFLEPGDLTGVAQPLTAFLQRELAPGDQVMLVSAGRGLEVLQGFTTVPERVIARFSELATPSGSRLGSAYRTLLLAVQRAKAQAVDLPARANDAEPRALLSQIDAFAAEATDGIARAAGRLGEMLGQLAGVPGRKSVLYLGGRLPDRAAQTLYDSWRNAFGSGSDHAFPNTPGAAPGGDTSTGGPDLFGGHAAGVAASAPVQPLGELAAVANAGEVTVYAVDLGALRGASTLLSFDGDPTLADRGLGGAGTADLDPGAPFADQPGLRALAEPTGGRALTGSRDLATVLRRLGEDLRAFYTLGFTPPAVDVGELHRLEVRLTDPGRGWTVRHRTSYRFKSNDLETAETALSAVLLGTADNPLAVELAPGAPRTDAGGVRRLPLTISVPLARLALVAEGSAHTGRLSIYFTSGVPGRGAAPVQKAVVPVRIPNRELLTALGRRVETTVDLSLSATDARSAAARIAVVVRDDFRPLTSTALAEVGPLTAGEAPDATAGAALPPSE